jgi:hypothetical protein
MPQKNGGLSAGRRCYFYLLSLLSHKIQAVAVGASLLVPAVWVLANSIFRATPVRGQARSY